MTEADAMPLTDEYNEFTKKLHEFSKDMQWLDEIVKTCQLETLSLHAPVFNEYRYLARAQAKIFEFLFASDPDLASARREYESAERGFRTVLNDAIDIIVLHIQHSLNKITERYRGFDLDSQSKLIGVDYLEERWPRKTGLVDK